MLTCLVTMSGLAIQNARRDFGKRANADGRRAKVCIKISHLDRKEMPRLRDADAEHRFLANIRAHPARALLAKARSIAMPRILIARPIFLARLGNS